MTQKVNRCSNPASRRALTIGLFCKPSPSLFREAVALEAALWFVGDGRFDHAAGGQFPNHFVQLAEYRFLSQPFRQAAFAESSPPLEPRRLDLPTTLAVTLARLGLPPAVFRTIRLA